MSLLEHVKKELDLVGIKENSKNKINSITRNNIIELIKVFSEQGHSGMSAPFTLNLFNKLAKYGILSPLTGKEDEWNKISDNLYQNNRCSHVFKEDGISYDNNGIIFREKDGECFTNKDSRVNITFPYTPKSEYVDV